MSLNVSNTYGSVFDVNVNDRFVGAHISTGRKDNRNSTPENPVWVNSYWNATFVGKCVESAKSLNQNDRIIIKNAVMSHEKSGKVDENGKNIYYYNLTIFDFDKAGKGNNKPVIKNPVTDVPAANGVEEGEDLPF